MPKKNILEDIAESNLKHPMLGAVASILFLSIGIYLTFSHGSSGPAGALFSGFRKLFSYFCYGLSAFVAIFAAIGYVKKNVGKKQRLEFFESNEPFWGCSTYPKCKEIVAYSDKA